jgi:hypothetical protein
VNGSATAPAISGGRGGRELYVRHAHKDGRPIAMLRAIDHGDSTVVEAQVTTEGGHAVRPGPYVFADSRDAAAFMTEAVEALIYLGCHISA